MLTANGIATLTSKQTTIGSSNMKKLALLLAITSGAAHAKLSDLDEYLTELDDLGYAVSKKEDLGWTQTLGGITGAAGYWTNLDQRTRFDVQLFRTSDDEVGIGFFGDDLSGTCNGFTEPEPARSIRINGTLIKAQIQCSNHQGRFVITPRTLKGQEFIYKQFRYGSKVRADILEAEVIFSAKGFTKLYNQYENERGGI